MINKYADSSKTALRISFDAKADVKIGNLSRGGKNRKETKADDHDFGVDGKITPVGVFLPKDKDLFLYMVKSKTTSDCYVDVLEKCWKDISNTYPELSRAYWSNPGDIAPPNGESWNQSSNRISACVDEINANIDCKNIIAVAHFGVILTQIQRAMEISPLEVIANKIDNFSITRIRYSNNKWSVIEINKVL